MKQEYYDIAGILDDTKKALEVEIIKSKAKLEFIEEFKAFLATNKLAVIREETPEENAKPEKVEK